MKGLIEYLFYDKAYSIGCRRLKDDKTPPKGGYYYILENTQMEWYADPFVFVHKGHVYVFCEIMKVMYGKGTLGVTEFNPTTGTFSRVTEILNEPFHLSYPNVFRWNDSIFMIPETNKANEIRLYEAIDFPLQWALKKTLVRNICAVDSSLLAVDGKKITLYTFLPRSKEIKCFCIDMNSLAVVDITNHYRNLSDERPGGNVIDAGGVKYRIIQDCTNCYGEKLKIYQINQIEADKFSEHDVGEIKATDIKCKSKYRYTRVHTLTRDEYGMFEAIDLFHDHFYWFKPFILVKRSLSRHRERRSK